jgi:hypothetical protein
MTSFKPFPKCERDYDQLQNLCQSLARQLADALQQNNELLQTTERVLNATVLNHRNERWHVDAEHTIEKVKLNQNL